MLNYEEFKVYVENHLKEYLPDDWANVEINQVQVQKNNGLVLDGLTVKSEDSNVAPNIYLNGFFMEYENGGELSRIMDEIADIAIANQGPKEFANIGRDFQNYDFIKDKVIMVAVNAKENEELLKDVPHAIGADLAIIYKVMLGENDSGYGTITIHNDHMKFWGATQEQLHELAMENTPELLPARVQDMREIMVEMFAKAEDFEGAEEIFPDEVYGDSMFVVSNAAKINGATVMFYPNNVLGRLADKLEDDLYIIPSSIHETIAIRATGADPEELARMVQEVNDSQVAKEERLSYHVYHFDGKSGVLSIADKAPVEMPEFMVAENQSKYETQDVAQSRPRHSR